MVLILLHRHHRQSHSTHHKSTAVIIGHGHDVFQNAACKSDGSIQRSLQQRQLCCRFNADASWLISIDTNPALVTTSISGFIPASQKMGIHLLHQQKAITYIHCAYISTSIDTENPIAFTAVALNSLVCILYYLK